MCTQYYNTNIYIYACVPISSNTLGAIGPRCRRTSSPERQQLVAYPLAAVVATLNSGNYTALYVLAALEENRTSYLDTLNLQPEDMINEP